MSGRAAALLRRPSRSAPSPSVRPRLTQCKPDAPETAPDGAHNFGQVRVESQSAATGPRPPLPYREAREMRECLRIMGLDSLNYCRREVLGEEMPAAAPLPPKTVSLNVMLLAGVTDTVSRDIARANAVFTPASLTFTASTSTLPPDVSSRIVGADNALQTNPAGPGGALTITDEERALVAQNFRSGVINVYYVPRLLGRPDIGYTLHGLRLDPIVIMDQGLNAGATGIGTLEHELGHALGLRHRGDMYQLMHDGPRADSRLIPSEIDTVRGSAYAR